MSALPAEKNPGARSSGTLRRVGRTRNGANRGDRNHPLVRRSATRTILGVATALAVFCSLRNVTRSSEATARIAILELVERDGPTAPVRKDRDRGSSGEREPSAATISAAGETGERHSEGKAGNSRSTRKHWTKAVPSKKRPAPGMVSTPSLPPQMATSKSTPLHINITTHQNKSENNSTATQSNQRIMLLITTHLSEEHIRSFDCCWPRLVKDSQLLGKVDVTVFTNFRYDFYNKNVTDRITNLFSDNPRVFYRSAPTNLALAVRDISHRDMRLQWSANMGVQLGFREGWFSGYDWLIRINPDVLIRNSTWLMETMKGMSPAGTGVDGIFVRCTPGKVHTDFFAVRPHALLVRHRADTNTTNTNTNTNTTNTTDTGKPDEDLPFSRLVDGNHEMTAAHYFRHILESGRYALLPDADRSRGFCRVRGNASSVVHDHNTCTRRRRQPQRQRLVPADNPSLSSPGHENLADDDLGYGDFVCNGLEGWDVA